MRTGRSLTVFRSLLPPGGGGEWLYLPGPGGVYLVQGGVPGLGVYLSGPRGEVPAWSQRGVPGVRVYLPGPRGCTWSEGGTCLVRGDVPAWSWEGEGV